MSWSPFATAPGNPASWELRVCPSRVPLTSHCSGSIPTRLVRPGMTMEEVWQFIVLEDPRPPTKEPLDLIWRAYIGLVEADSASFRVSGGWIGRDCNLTFGVRRGPVEMMIADFRWPRDDPSLAYLDLKPGEYFITYSPEHGRRFWQLQEDKTWSEIEVDVLVNASHWWVWQGKLLRTLRSLIMDGVPEDMVVEETATTFSLRATLGPSLVNMWRWEDSYESLVFELVVDRETGAIEGYIWEMHDAYEGDCVFREEATDGQIGVDISLPESVRREHEAGLQ